MTTYNLKVTDFELEYLRKTLDIAVDIWGEAEEPEDRIYTKVSESLLKRIENKDYTKICWGKKANKELKDKIAKLETEIQLLKQQKEKLYLCPTRS